MDGRGIQGQITDLFDGVAEGYATVPFFHEFGERIVARSGIGAGDEILDVATGRGAVLRPAARVVGSSGSVVGTDISPAMIHELEADARGEPNISLEVMDAGDMSFPDEAFDAAFCGFAMHIVPEPRKVLAEVFRVLKPGGVLAFSIPGPASGDRWDFYRDAMRDAAPAARAGKWSPPKQPDFEALASRAGFVPVEKTHEETRVPVADAEAFWEMEMLYGMRGFILALPEKERGEFKARTFRGLEEMERREGGIILDKGAYFIKGVKPG